MKTKTFLSRIGSVDTPPCLRKSRNSLKALALLLVMVASVNLWGADTSVQLCTSWNKTLAYTTEYTQNYTIDDLNGGTTTMTLGVKGVYRQSNANTYFQMNKKEGYFKNTTKLPGKITKIVTTWNALQPATKCYFATNAEASSSDKTVEVSTATSVTYTPPSGADYYYFNIDPKTGSGSAQMTSCIVYYTTADIPSEPYTVTFNAGSGTCVTSSLTEKTAGAGVTLPSASPSSSCATAGWEFAGWSATNCAETLTAPTLYAATTKYYPSSNCTLYAVYKHAEIPTSGPAVGTTLWAEDFSDFSANDVPSSSNKSTSVYGGATLTYSCVNGGSNTKIYNEKLAEGTAPELLVGKSTGSFTASNVPTGNATTMVLTYLANNTCALTSSTPNVVVSKVGSTTGKGEYKWTVTASSTISTIALTISSSTSNNTRLDNILLKVDGEVTYNSSPSCAAPTEKYTVSFDAQGKATNPAALTEENPGEGIELPNITDVTGYTLAGWATTAEKAAAGTADAGKAGNTYQPKENCKLFAVWSVNKHKVTYILGEGASGCTDIAEQAYGTEVTVCASAKKTHYTFTSWSVTKGGVTIVNGKFTMPDEDVELTANWEEIAQVIVTFKNSGSESSTKSVYVGDPIGDLPTLTEANACDPHSRTFVGWTSAEAWEGKVASFDNFVTTSTPVTEPMELNAVWAEGGGVYDYFIADGNVIETGNYVIEGYNDYDDKDYAMSCNINGSNYMTSSQLSFNDDEAIENPSEDIVWKLTKIDNNHITIYSEKIGKYLNIVPNTTHTKFELSDSPIQYIVSKQNNGEYDQSWLFSCATTNLTSYQIRCYYESSAVVFRAYNSQTYALYLYKQNLTNYITTCSTDPLIEVSTESLNGFSTIATAGPSAAQSFMVEGYNLTENITVSAPTGYEVSTTEASDYTSSLTLTAINGIVAKTPVYVRLAAADEAKDNVTGNITLVSSNTEQTVALSGTIIAKTLNSISVATAPTKKTYTIGEKFNPEGLVITATYNSGNETVNYADHESEFSFSPALDAELTASDNKVTITWGGKSKDQSITMQCTVAWQVNGQPWTEGTPTTLVNVGSEISAMPTAPTSEACNGKTFMGWSAKTVAKTDDEPEMFAKLADFTALNAHTTYHAVFAKEGEIGDPTLTKLSSTSDLAVGVNIVVVAAGNDFQKLMYQETVSTSYVAYKTVGTGTGEVALTANAIGADVKNYWTLSAGSDGKWKLGDATNGYLYNESSNDLTADKSNASNWTIAWDNNKKAFSIKNGSRWLACRSDLTGDNQYKWRGGGTTLNGTGYLDIYKFEEGSTNYVEYSTTCFEPVDAPEFDLAEGTYKTIQEVELTCATEDSKIYYSINGGEVTEYTAKIQLEERGTYSITAYAKVGEERISDPVTKVYTLNLPFADIQAMYAANLADNTEEVGLTLTGAYINKVYSVAANRQIFVQQGNVGAILAMSGDVPEGLADGKALTATVWGTYKINNGRPQLSNFTLVEGYQVADGTRPTPEVITSLDAEKVSTNLLGLVTMKGIYSISKESNDITMNSQADGLGTNYALYNIFSAVKALPEQSLACDVIGLFNVKDGAYSIIPIVAATDFKLQTSKEATLPNIDIVGGAAPESPVLVPANQVVTLTAVDGFDAYYKVNGGTEAKFTGAKTVTITEPTSITLRGARDYYTDVTVTYYYGVDAAHTVHAVNKPAVGPYTYSTDKASAEAGELVTMTITPSEHWNILLVKAEYNDGEADQSITATSIGDNKYTFEMPDYDVKIKVDRKQDPTYSVTYLKGGKTTEGEDPQNSSHFEGDIVTVATNHWTVTGYTFEGWKITYINGESQEVEITPEDGEFEMPAFDVKITATWKKIASFGWKLVESTSDLTVGDKVVIACNTQKAAAGAISSNIMGQIAATFSEDLKYLTSELTNVVIMTLGGESGAWTFANDNSQLLGATSEKNLAWNGANATNTWNITFSEEGVMKMANTKADNAYGSLQYNSNQPRFTTYKSNQTPIQLYKRTELAYIVTYVANGGSNPPADTYADQDGTVTITSLQPTWNNAHLFIGWNTDKDGNGEEYVAGQTYTIEDNLKLYAQWKTVTEHSITFVAGEGVTGSVPTMSKKYEGMTFEMPDKGTLEKTDFVFRGWNDGTATYLAGETYTMPGNDITFDAVWESKADSKWHLVTNAQMLTDGSKIIIAAADYDKALSEIQDKKDFCDAIDVEKQVDSEHFNDQKLIDENQPVIFTLVKNEDGSFSFQNGEKYLSVKETSSNMTYSASIDNLSSWTITITEEKTTIKSNKDDATIYLQYNSDAPRFNGYTGTQKAVAIYKYIDGVKAVRTMAANTYTTWCMPQGVEVGNCYGATFWNIIDKTYMEDERLSSITIEQHLDNLGAGVPYIMLPEGESTEFVYYATGEQQEAAGTNNGLVGVFEDTPFADVADDEAAIARGIYVISDGVLYLCGNNCGVYANRAYIQRDQINYVAPSGAPRRTIGGKGMPTILDNIFGNPAQAIQKLIINNQLIIIRHGHFYNAAGARMK